MARDPGRLGALIYVVTVETSRPVQVRHALLCSYRGNLKIVCVCISHLLSGGRSSVETSIMPAYVCIWYCSISAWRSFTLLPWKRELVVAVISNVHICETQFCILASPAIW